MVEIPATVFFSHNNFFHILFSSEFATYDRVLIDPENKFKCSKKHISTFSATNIDTSFFLLKFGARALYIFYPYLKSDIGCREVLNKTQYFRNI